MLLVAAWSSLCAVATGGLVWFIMHSRMEVRLARQREKLAEARATLEAQKQGIQGAMQGVEETTRRKALDDFLADLRIEERHYVREHKILFVTRKLLVRLWLYLERDEWPEGAEKADWQTKAKGAGQAVAG